MASQTRLDNFNNWPKVKLFDAEITFNNKLKEFEFKELFKPCQIKSNNDKNIHIIISFLLDMVDSLPKRPDHSFDWAWKAFEHFLTQYSGDNLTNSLRIVVEGKLIPILSNQIQINKVLFELIQNIPLQSCEYLLKKILKDGPYELKEEKDNFKPFTGRLITKNGNKKDIVNPRIQKLFSHIYVNFNFNDNEQRRNAALLIRKSLQGKEISLKKKTGDVKIKLENNDILLILLSGLTYSFRNDRTHAESISPFKSSTARIKTYAHCWFLFLFIYEVLNILLMDSNMLENNHKLAENIKLNTDSFTKLFKSQLGK